MMHGFMSVRLSVCHKSELCFGSLQTVLFSSISTHHSTDLLTARGVAHLVVHGTSGSTSYETIPPFVRLESSGGVLSTVVMVVQRRDGFRAHVKIASRIVSRYKFPLTAITRREDNDRDCAPPVALQGHVICCSRR